MRGDRFLRILKYPRLAARFVGVLAGLGFVVMGGWNWLMPGTLWMEIDRLLGSRGTHDSAQDSVRGIAW
jgi:hypothetical protein